MEKLLKQIITKLDTLERGQEELKSGQRELFDIVKALEHRQEETTAQIAVMTEDMSYIKGEITRLSEGQKQLVEEQKRLADEQKHLAEEQKQLAEGKNRQERLLEILCRRSLEQEDVIRDLRQVK